MYPMTKQEAGPAYWTVLFNYAAQFPEYPTDSQRAHANSYIRNIVDSFVCQECVGHAREYMAMSPVQSDNRKALVKWMCGLKNNANRQEGKKEIDCDVFYEGNLGQGGCPTCSVINQTPVYKGVTRVQQPYDNSFYNIYDWDKRYPSLKRSFNFDGPANPGAPPYTQATQPGSPIVPAASAQGQTPLANQQSLQNPYMLGLDEISKPVEEELDGILKPLDNIYAFPASVVGVKPSEFNLAYTPEMTANLFQLINQMFLTNFGSMATTFLTSVSLLGISVFAKNNISHYDKLFMQNTIASLLFHTMNFINPRIKDEILPSGTEFIEGLMAMDFEKIKKSLIYNYEAENSTDDLMAMLKHRGKGGSKGGGLIDMEKLKVPKASLLGGGAASSFQASTIRDLQSASQRGFDSRLGGVGSLGGGASNTGVLNKNDIERMFNSRRSSRLMSDYTYNKNLFGSTTPDFGMLDDVNDEYGYIIDNNLF